MVSSIYIRGWGMRIKHCRPGNFITTHTHMATYQSMHGLEHHHRICDYDLCPPHVNVTLSTVRYGIFLLPAVHSEKKWR